MKVSDFIPTCIIHVILLKKTVTTPVDEAGGSSIWAYFFRTSSASPSSRFIYFVTLFLHLLLLMYVFYTKLYSMPFPRHPDISIYDVGDRVSNIC